MRLKQDIYRKKLCGVQHSITMADFLMYETQHPIIVIIYSSYFLEVLVELEEYILPRKAISSSFSSYWSVELEE